MTSEWRCRPGLGAPRPREIPAFQKGDDLVSLRGAVLRTVTEAGLAERDVTSRTEYQEVLERRFGIRLPAAELDALWQAVWARHLAWRAAE